MKLKKQVVRAILFIVRVQRLTKNRKKSSLYPNRNSSSEEKVDTNGGQQGTKIRPTFGRNASAISFATHQPEKSFFGRKRFNNREGQQHDIQCKCSQNASSSGHTGVSVSSLSSPKHHPHHRHVVSFAHLRKPYFMATTEDDNIIEKYSSPRHKPSTSYLNNGGCEAFPSSAKRTTIMCNSIMCQEKKTSRHFLFSHDSSFTCKNGCTDNVSTCEFLSKSLSQETLQENDNNYNTVVCPMKGFKGKRKGSLDLSELQADSALASLTTLTMGLAQIHKASEHERQDDVGHNLELFTSIYQNDMDTVQTLFKKYNIDVNSRNFDDLTPLDVAILLDNNVMAKFLLKVGATEDEKLAVPGNRTKHFSQLIESAEFALITSRNQLVDIVSNPSTPQTSGLAKALQKQMNCTDNRLHVLRKMLNHFKKLDVPSRPQNVRLQVGSSNSIVVELGENPENPIVTKYKIEWSTSKNFDTVEGTKIVKDLRTSKFVISNLNSNVPYYVRVATGNFKGFSLFFLPQNMPLITSCWRDVSSKQSIDTQSLHSKLFKLQDEIETIKASDDWESLLCYREYDDRKKKSTLMPFFQTPRLQRSLKRGLYLATIFYNEVKVLLTNEDCLPIVQVDESPPFNFSTEFLWFFKLSYAWGELKFLSIVESQRMQHSNVFLRSKMIDASTAMQDILETRDLGHLHFEPIVYKEQEIVILVTVSHIRNAKFVQAMNLKWVGMDKIFRRCSGSLGRENDLMALLSNSLLDCLNFYESSMVPLDKGLYCGYLKLHSSLNQINILVPENLPNVVPFVKIRRISHVTREEWECVKNLREQPTSAKKKHNNAKSVNSNNQKREFHESLTTAIDFLLTSLGLVVQKSGSFSIYDSEIIAVNLNVNFIMILPPASEFCTGPGQQKISSEKRSNCMSLPISIFEIVNFYSYNPQFLALYCRLSTFVEYFTFILQQIHRQVSNDQEMMTICKKFMDQMENCQKRLDDVWKASRWVTSIVSSCRAKKLSDIGVPLTFLNGDDRHFGSSPSISRVRFFRSETDTAGTLNILEDFDNNNAKRSQDETINYANSDDIFSSSDIKCDPELSDHSDHTESKKSMDHDDNYSARASRSKMLVRKMGFSFDHQNGPEKNEFRKRLAKAMSIDRSC